MRITTFKNIDGMKDFFGFNVQGIPPEGDSRLLNPKTKEDERKLNDANIIATFSRNMDCDCLEIGTAFGDSTMRLALNTFGSVYTVNPLPHQISGKIITFDKPLTKDQIGQKYKARREAYRNIFQIYENSKNVELPERLETIGVALIDGCHDRGYVLSDSLLVAEKAKFILWHDFSVTYDEKKEHWIKQVMLGVEDFCKEKAIEEVWHVENSWVGICRL